ncbi:hypothetical protein FOA52_009415 [Chlamydomonas sp. UWO 241]|nr:hypothetical protein FOA52_009415 [Chlamydomonas sp. UWO 241]
MLCCALRGHALRAGAGGGSAVVYSARDLSNGGHVALKVMYGPDQVPFQVVQREVAFASTIKHGNLVRMLDVFREGRQAVIAAPRQPPQAPTTA